MVSTRSQTSFQKQLCQLLYLWSHLTVIAPLGKTFASISSLLAHLDPDTAATNMSRGNTMYRYLWQIKGLQQLLDQAQQQLAEAERYHGQAKLMVDLMKEKTRVIR